MEKDEFWDFIERSKLGSDDCEEQANSLAKLLVKLTPDEIVEFDRVFKQHMVEAYRWDLWGVAFIINGGCSDDGFEYFCYWLIGLGRAAFEGALLSPETAADFASDEGEEAECENIGYSAAEAYETLTGNQIQTPSNLPEEPAGDPWREEELATLFPNVSARFA